MLHKFCDLKGQNQRFKIHVTFGLNFLLTLEDTKFNLQHNVVIGLDREGVHNLFQYTFFPLDRSDISTSSSTCDSTDSCEPTGKVKFPRIQSCNVWNTNPSANVYGYKHRWQRYVLECHFSRDERDANYMNALVLI